MAMAVLPTELGLHRALAIARWVSWVWTAVVAAVAGDELRYPAVAWVGVAAALGIAVAGTIGVRAPATATAAQIATQQVGRPWIGSPQFATVQGGVAIGLLVLDGVAFERGHVFASGQNLAAASPAISAIAVGVSLGAIPGAIGGAVIASGRYFGALANDSTWIPSRVISILSSMLFLGLAGGVAGWGTKALVRVETEVVTRRERDRIARTLHDTVLQTLAIVGRRTEDPELAELARRTDRDLRRLLYGPVATPARTLTSAIRTAAGRAAEPFGFELVVNVVDDERPTVGSTAEAAATAIAEAVSNAGKHARASRVVVYAEAGDDGVFATVRDDGSGFDPSTADAGQGLRASIRQPVEERGGRVEIDSKPDAGTEVRLWLP